MLIKGTDLTARQRMIVRSAFVHRHTIENAARRGVDCVLCADATCCGRIVTGTNAAPRVWTRAEWHAHHVPAIADDTWIAAHAFHFTADGSRLHGRYRHAEPAYLAE
jgi:hypothetical protein